MRRDLCDVAGLWGYLRIKINVKEKGKVNDNTAKMQSTNQLGV